MRNTCRSLALALLFSVVSLLSAQTPKRFESGPLTGFVESPTEHFLDPIQESLRVRSIRGVLRHPDGEPLPEAIVEIRDSTGKVCGVQTNERGEFRMLDIPFGTYDFKFTKNGFQSIVGKIEVSKSAPRKNRIALAMKLGV